MIRTDKKRDGAIEFADPDLGGSGVKIESTFFVYLGCGIRGRKNLDANVRCALKKDQPLDVLDAFRGEPGDIQSFHTVGSGERAFGQALTAGKELVQQGGEMSLAPAVKRSRRRTHEDVAVPIGLDAAWKLGEKWVG